MLTKDKGAARHVPGITVVEPASSRPAGEYCCVYTLGQDWEPIMEEILTQWDEVTDPQPGDVVFYLNNNKDRDPVHVGRMVSATEVESKWGSNGDVLRHPVWYVPYDYGDTPAFFRRQG